jgi:hypothetical protein
MERRGAPRTGVTTLVTAVYPDADPCSVTPRTFPGWSEDISRSGARLALDQALSERHVWLRFIGRGYESELIDATVVRVCAPDGPVAGPTACSYVYAVRFKQLLSSDEFARLVRVEASPDEVADPRCEPV